MSIKRLGEGNLSRILGKIKTALDGKSDTNHTHSNYLTSANVASVVEADNNNPVSSAAVNTALNNVGGALYDIITISNKPMNISSSMIGKLILIKATSTNNILIINGVIDDTIPVGAYFYIYIDLESNSTTVLGSDETDYYGSLVYMIQYSSSGSSAKSECRLMKTSPFSGNRGCLYKIVKIASRMWMYA